MPQTVRVYQIDQLTDTLSEDSTYYTNQTFNTLPTNLVNGTFSFTPHPTDSVSVDGTDGAGARLSRFPLNINLANTFLALLQNPIYQSNTAWIKQLSGRLYKDRSGKKRRCDSLL